MRGLNLMRNYGQHNALLCGIRAAKYDVIVTMDDDLQHPPEEIPRLLEQLEQGFDVVYGAPEGRTARIHARSCFPHYAARAGERHRNGSRQERECVPRFPYAIARGICRAIKRRLFPSTCCLTWATTRFAAIPVVFQPRHSGSSNYTFTKLVRHALDMMTGFSTAPLQLASLIGFGCTLFGLAVFLYVFIRYCLEGSVPGFPFLASIIAIFSGAQLFALGVIGEYLAACIFG